MCSVFLNLSTSLEQLTVGHQSCAGIFVQPPDEPENPAPKSKISSCWKLEVDKVEIEIDRSR